MMPSKNGKLKNKTLDQFSLFKMDLKSRTEPIAEKLLKLRYDKDLDEKELMEWCNVSHITWEKVANIMFKIKKDLNRGWEREIEEYNYVIKNWDLTFSHSDSLRNKLQLYPGTTINIEIIEGFHLWIPLLILLRREESLHHWFYHSRDQPHRLSIHITEKRK